VPGRPVTPSDSGGASSDSSATVSEPEATVSEPEATVSDPEAAPSEARPTLFGPRLFAGAVMILAAVVLVEAFRIPEARGFRVLGPRAFPLIVAVGLLVLGVAFLLRTTLVPDQELAAKAGQEEAATHWPTVGLAAAGLVAYAYTLEPLGFIVATSAFVPVEARILGSRHPLRDGAVGVAVAVAMYFGFDRFLGVRLPDGVLAPLL
jgi:putative tricarboxylic transport membrane protein